MLVFNYIAANLHKLNYAYHEYITAKIYLLSNPISYVYVSLQCADRFR